MGHRDQLEEVKMNEYKLLVSIKAVLREAKRWTGDTRRILLEVAFDLMRQYQELIEYEFELTIIRCGYCGQPECSH